METMSQQEDLPANRLQLSLQRILRKLDCRTDVDSPEANSEADRVMSGLTDEARNFLHLHQEPSSHQWPPQPCRTAVSQSTADSRALKRVLAWSLLRNDLQKAVAAAMLLESSKVEPIDSLLFDDVMHYVEDRGAGSVVIPPQLLLSWAKCLQIRGDLHGAIRRLNAAQTTLTEHREFFPCRCEADRIQGECLQLTGLTFNKMCCWKSAIPPLMESIAVLTRCIANAKRSSEKGSHPMAVGRALQVSVDMVARCLCNITAGDYLDLKEQLGFQNNDRFYQAYNMCTDSATLAPLSQLMYIRLQNQAAESLLKYAAQQEDTHTRNAHLQTVILEVQKSLQAHASIADLTRREQFFELVRSVFLIHLALDFSADARDRRCASRMEEQARFLYAEYCRLLSESEFLSDKMDAEGWGPEMYGRIRSLSEEFGLNVVVAAVQNVPPAHTLGAPGRPTTQGEEEGREEEELTGKVFHHKAKNASEEKTQQSGKQAAAIQQSSEQAAAIRQSGKQAAVTQQSSEQAAAIQQNGKQAAAIQQSGKQAAVIQQSSEQAAAIQQNGKQAAAIQQSGKQAAVIQQSSEQAAAVRQSGKQAAVIQQSGKQAAVIQQIGKQAAVIQQSSEQAAAIQQSRKQAAATQHSRKQAAAIQQSGKQAAVIQQIGKQAAVIQQSSEQAAAIQQSGKQAAATQHSGKQAAAIRQSSEQAATKKERNKEQRSARHGHEVGLPISPEDYAIPVYDIPLSIFQDLCGCKFTKAATHETDTQLINPDSRLRDHAPDEKGEAAALNDHAPPMLAIPEESTSEESPVTLVDTILTTKMADTEIIGSSDLESGIGSSCSSAADSSSADSSTPVTSGTPRGATLFQSTAGTDLVKKARLLKFNPVTGLWNSQTTLVHVGRPLRLEDKLKGSCRDVFHVQFLHQDEVLGRYVGKRYRRQRPPSRYLQDVTCQKTARFLVTLFNYALKDLRYDIQVVYVPVAHVQLLSRDGEEVEDWLNVEPYLEGDFIKLTNNLTFCNSQGRTLATALTHFTHSVSQGRLMLVDLQGWLPCGEEGGRGVVYLTDPQFHTSSPSSSSSSSTPLSSCDMGERGMRAFFESVHPTCNTVCHALGLKRPELY
ncbi:uncharacterized protein LOC143285418 isoform X2 [Babylonia areolata]|uniref:uncharacterized protein LOC143285418 isoform X2 n=1 Tax=Babylonia areolata TaxID=304850 RepID=UPI003FD1B889